MLLADISIKLVDIFKGGIILALVSHIVCDFEVRYGLWPYFVRVYLISTEQIGAAEQICWLVWV